LIENRGSRIENQQPVAVGVDRRGLAIWKGWFEFTDSGSSILDP
jgi:hypothetical protein